MRARKSFIALLLVGILLLSVAALSSCQSSTSQNGKYSEAIKTARDKIWQDINSGKASSGQAAILDGGNIVYSEAFGMADRDTSTPVTTNTLFNSGSIGKTYCTTAVMKLVDDGKVKLDSPVTQYLPDFKMADARYKDITVRMLLDHQSGLPGTTSANDFGYKVNPDLYAQVYDNLSRQQLKAAPGYSAPYCNDGFTLAEMLVAKVSGQKYIDYVTSQILEPLSLTRTGPSIGARPDAGVAAYYEAESGKKVPPEAVTLLGAGGLSATAEELLKFGDSFTSGGKHILSQASIDDVIKAHPSTWAKAAQQQVGFNPELAYGLGLDMVSLPEFETQGIKVIGKGGDTQDFHSQLLVVPDKRIAVAVMEAGHGSSAGKTAIEMMNNVLVGKGLMKKEPTPVTVPKTPQPLPAGYESYSGIYNTGTEVATLTVDMAGNTVTLAKSEGEASSMFYNDGLLYDEEGSVKALLSVDGQTALVRGIFGLYITSAQKIPAASDPQSLAVDINGSMWLRRNAKPYESMSYTSGYAAISSTNPELPGYVIVAGSNLVESPMFAGLNSPVLRDLSELFLEERNGQTWLRLSDFIFSPATAAAPLNAEQKSVTIGADGYNEWLKTGQDVVLEVSKPDGDRVVVIDPDGKTIYDSVVDNGGVFVPAGSLVELAGSPGDAFTVSAKSPSGN